MNVNRLDDKKDKHTNIEVGVTIERGRGKEVWMIRIGDVYEPSRKRDSSHNIQVTRPNDVEPSGKLT
jgi:hypothetical protein